VLVTEAVGHLAVTLAWKVSVTLQPTGILGTLTAPVPVFKVGVEQLEVTEVVFGITDRPEAAGSGSVISTSNASVVPLFVTLTVKVMTPPGITLVGEAVFNTSSFGSTILMSVLAAAAGVGAPLMNTL
jgi:hypothetical protein